MQRNDSWPASPQHLFRPENVEWAFVRRGSAWEENVCGERKVGAAKASSVRGLQRGGGAFPGGNVCPGWIAPGRARYVVVSNHIVAPISIVFEMSARTENKNTTSR